MPFVSTSAALVLTIAVASNAAFSKGGQEKHLVRREHRQVRTGHVALDAEARWYDMPSKSKSNGAAFAQTGVVASAAGEVHHPIGDSSLPVRSCRHSTWVDTANPNRMKTGSYCVDVSDTTAAADGSVASQSSLDDCTSWTEGGGGFTQYALQCPEVKSCRHPTFSDTANPERMKYSGIYCADATENTKAADGSFSTQAELDSCRVWTTGGGGFIPSLHLCGESPDSDDAKCNSFTCPTDFYLRRNAPDLQCAAVPCTEAADRTRCCKALTREVENKWCKGSQALNWFEDFSLSDCVTWAVNTGAVFLIYGKGNMAGRCWWQRSDADHSCTGEACCQCDAPAECAWEEAEYDFYKLS